MKHKIYLYLFILCALGIQGCKEAEVQPFSGDLGVIFVAATTDDNIDPERSLNQGVDFAKLFFSEGPESTSSTVKVALQLEGYLQELPTKIYLKSEVHEDNPLLQVILPAEVIIEPQKAFQIVEIKVLRPKEYDKLYAAKISIDYEKSHIIPGEKGRQHFTITGKDMISFNLFNVKNVEEWNSAFSQYLGPYGSVKIRYLFYALSQEPERLSTEEISDMFYYTQFYPDFPAYGIHSPDILQYLQKSVEEYNGSHDQPLQEPDGTLVSFTPTDK